MYDALIREFQAKLKFAPDFKKTVKFIVTDRDGDVIIVDAAARPATVSRDDGAADVTLFATLDTFEKLMNGTMDPNIAFMTRKLKIQGSMGVAMRLNALLED